VGFLAGAEYREESFKDDRDPRLDGTIQFTNYKGETFPFISDVANSSPTFDNRGSRDVTSLFTEFAVPLHATLDLQLALRYENFSDVGSTTVPKIAFGWRPTDWFMLRGSWSEAFRAPNLITVNEAMVVRSNTRTDSVCDYARRNSTHPDAESLDCSSSVQRRAFGNEDLKPEKSDNYSIGTVLTPTPNLTFTIDFFKIEKKDTIGLFGETNHTALDLLQRLEAGAGNCGSVSGNPLVERGEAEADDTDIYAGAGLCPVGEVEAVNDTYVNLDTRIVEGFDFGVYFDLPTDIGDWAFSWRGSIYTRYDQEPGPAAQTLIDGFEAGIIDSQPEGFGDILRKDGNQEEKMNASVRWDRNAWSASLAWFYLSDFLDLDAQSNIDGSYWKVSSHSYFNASADYRFDVFGSQTRVRLGVRNLTNERAPLADGYFGFANDAHNDFGRSYYIDVRMAW
jgi:outer membrane receptor protein involved in Fe transport